jgi:phosphoserine phosphatase RsbU/P
MCHLLAKGRRPPLGIRGHPPVLWLDTGEELSGGRAPPLGLSEELAYTPAAHHHTPGTGVLLYTDGVTEARHNGEQFGQARLAQIVQALGGQAPSEAVAAVTTEVEQFAATGLADDLCVVAARIGEGLSAKRQGVAHAHAPVSAGRRL